MAQQLTNYRHELSGVCQPCSGHGAARHGAAAIPEMPQQRRACCSLRAERVRLIPDSCSPAGLAGLSAVSIGQLRAPGTSGPGSRGDTDSPELGAAPKASPKDKHVSPRLGIGSSSLPIPLRFGICLPSRGPAGCLLCVVPVLCLMPLICVFLLL